MKPGECRILRALEDGPLSGPEIKEKASLANPNIRAKYLKSLWKRGLITQDIDTRKYQLAAMGWEMLYLRDIEGFLSERISQIGSQGLNGAGVILTTFPGITILGPSLNPLMDELHDDDLTHASFEIMKILNRLVNKWRLQGRSDKERKILEIRSNVLDEALERQFPIIPNLIKSDPTISTLTLSQILDLVMKALPEEACQSLQSKLNTPDPEGEKLENRYVKGIMEHPKALVIIDMGFEGYLEKWNKIVSDIKAEFPPTLAARDLFAKFYIQHNKDDGST